LPSRSPILFPAPLGPTLSVPLPRAHGPDQGPRDHCGMVTWCEWLPSAVSLVSSNCC
jgi:hypothetical protein